VTRLVWRTLLGFGVGALLAFVNQRWGLGLLFLGGLCVAALFCSRGMGFARFLVAVAIWLGQYSVFWLRIIAPFEPSAEAVHAVSLLQGLMIFLPAIAIFTGTYLGLLVDRYRRLFARH